MNKYIHVFRDHGQNVCEECSFRGDDDLEEWEYFMNGHWVDDPPTVPGMYLIIFMFRGNKKQGYAKVIKSRKTKLCNWSKKMADNIVLRWSEPLPTNAPQTEENNA